MMRVCNRCIQPDTRPGIYFNEQGTCGACLWEERKKEIDWKSRERELEEIAEWAKKTKTRGRKTSLRSGRRVSK